MNEQTRPSRVRSPCPRVRALTVSNLKSDYGPVQQAEASGDEFEYSVSNDTAIEKSRAPGDSDTDQSLFSPLFAQRMETIVSQAHRHLPETLIKERLAMVESSSAEGNPESRVKVSGPGSEKSDHDSIFAPKPRVAPPALEKNFMQAKINHESGRLDDQVAAGSPPSSEGSTIELEHPAHEQGRVGVRPFVHPPHFSHAPHHSQFELARMKLKGYVVTEAPSLGDCGNEDERNSAAGSEKTHTRFNIHEAMNSPFSINMLASRATSSLRASSSRSDATANFTSEPSGESGVEQDAARESHFAYTLARLEGHVPPSSSSPIQRHVYPEWWYNDNVEVEHSGPVLRCPRPRRQANRVGLGPLFHMGAVDGSGGLELHGSAATDIPSERLANLTLDYSIFHNDEPSPIQKYERYESDKEMLRRD